MNMSGLELILIPVFLLIGLVVAFIVVKRNNRAADLHIRMGEQLGIKVAEEGSVLGIKTIPDISGYYKNFSIRIFKKLVRGSKNKRYTYTIIQVMFDAGNFEFELEREGFFQKVGKVLGMKDIQTGYEEFDKAFVLKSNAEDIAIKLFDTKLCNEVLSVRENIKACISFSKGRMIYEERYIISDEERMQRYLSILDLMISISTAVKS